MLCNRLVAIVFALCMIYRNNENVQNTAPIKNYMMVSVSNFLATYCQYEGIFSIPTGGHDRSNRSGRQHSSTSRSRRRRSASAAR